MSEWVLTAAVVLMLSIVPLLTHLLLTWFERRGWVYYRSTERPRPKPIGLIDEIFQPSMTHVIDHETHEDSLRENSESSAPRVLEIRAHKTDRVPSLRRMPYQISTYRSATRASNTPSR